MNTLKTTLLMGLLTVLLVIVGGAIGGRNGMTFAFLMAAGMNFFSYWFSDKIVLSMYGAREIGERDDPRFYGIVRRLAASAGLPMPKVYLIDSETPNAFATGRNPEHAAVAATSGILRILNEDELAGVMAHELAHVKHRDILVSTLAATFAGAITYLAHMAQWAAIFGGGRRDDNEGGGVFGMLFMAILAPIAAMLVQMAISRSREFGADAGGASISHNPLSLASALQKLEMANQRIPMDATPATAHMFIVNPLTGGSLMSLFSTHPPMAERIARLQEMSRTRSY
ncbi:zinc metalloprotease HtpX [Geobacter sp. SVR]|uniref:zinc metalloprotease HtpX n=1 Tax=Geobacter sp. SVR TaxID=2495594 RepID=UPI00143EF6A8|nr:zinc metalloprotease HtpX [Geobacter sp. SVR]BCS52349.1 protease HtpX [Geobacter sp. SVR]GCF84992.1 protease HtpX [Geobacter sp. SVR]